jgi:Flp pilus assembly protein TadD
MKALLFSLMTVALAGCASAPVAGNLEPLFADALFQPQSRPVGAEDIFALSDEMKTFVVNRVQPQFARKDLQAALFSAIEDELRLDYDAAHTQSAAATFAAHSGNCLSLVIMTAAFAKHLGVPVTYRSVYGHETWSRAGGIAFRSGHLNLQLGVSRPTDSLSSPLVIDFLAPESAARLYSRAIPEEMVLAMYLNNRAAEALVDGDTDNAYWLARAAVQASPSFLSALNTLGVVYLRHGNLREAERPLRYVLEREPDNANTLSNLETVLLREGRTADAAMLHRRLAAITPYPPFYFLDLGLSALDHGDTESALELLNQELHRMPYDDEVHFAIAVADFRKGDLRHARQHLDLALENSTTRDRRSIYAAKLNYLKNLEQRN